MKVVVGLGNPGAKYAGTRHNIGFEVVDYLAAAPGVSAYRMKYESFVADFAEGGEQVLLVKPETFMNLSGRAVRQVLDFHKVPESDLLVVCDDIALPLGKLRARAGGSHGGQNGLRNIEAQLGGNNYARLRIGVGEPGLIDAAAYVLSRFKPGERPAVEKAVSEAAAGVMTWIRQGIDAAMNRVNAGEPRPKKPKPAAGEKETKKDQADGPAKGPGETGKDVCQ